jgi:hypothetical protein
MSKRQSPTRDALDKLLAWLDTDHDKAVELYERIYFRVVRILAAKGCFEAEELADQTVNVVASKINELKERYHGDPALFFYGVAKKIHQEWLKRRTPPLPPPLIDNTETELRCGCLEKCLEKIINAEEATMVVRYHQGEGQERIENRKKMAAELGITLNALRIRICHLQARLRPCIEECLKEIES